MVQVRHIHINFSILFVLTVWLPPGMLLGMPHSFFQRVVKEELGQTLGAANSYGAGNVFLPKSDAITKAITELFAHHCQERGLRIIGWRSLKTGN